MPTASSGNHYALTDSKASSITQVTSANSGKTVELFDANNVSLAPESQDTPDTPDVPSTGIVANLLCGGMLGYVTFKKRSI